MLTPQQAWIFIANFKGAMFATRKEDFFSIFETFSDKLDKGAYDAMNRLKLKESAKCWAECSVSWRGLPGFAESKRIHCMLIDCVFGYLAASSYFQDHLENTPIGANLAPLLPLLFLRVWDVEVTSFARLKQNVEFQVCSCLRCFFSFRSYTATRKFFAALLRCRMNSPCMH